MADRNWHATVSGIPRDSTVLRGSQQLVLVARFMQDSFQKHAIESGRQLLQLKEDHLKEMGVGKVGHRLRLCEHLRELRRLAEVTADGVDMDSLLSQ